MRINKRMIYCSRNDDLYHLRSFIFLNAGIISFNAAKLKCAIFSLLSNDFCYCFGNHKVRCMPCAKNMLQQFYSVYDWFIVQWKKGAMFI